mgnify:CR=1 FL=1
MSSIIRNLDEATRRTLIMLGLVMALGFIVRLIPITYSIVAGQVNFPEFDPYYHMRRIAYTVEHFPFFGIYDSYVNYPQGYMIGWPPLLDLIAASLALIFGLGSPDRFTIEMTSAMLPVVIGTLTLIPLYYLVKDAMGRNAALIAALIMAILPGSVFRTLFGFIDHHALEVLISLTMYLLFTRSIYHAKKEGLTLQSLRSGVQKHKSSLGYAALAGTATAGMIFTWDGAPIFISIIVGYALLQFAYDAYKKDRSDYLACTGTAAMLVALAIVAPFAATSYTGQNFAISALYLSWFQILFLFACMAFYPVAGGLANIMASHKAPWYALPGSLIAGAAALLLVLKFALPQFFASIEAGLTFLSGGSSVLQTIVEVEPLLSYGGEFSLIIPWTYFSTAFILAILGLIAYLLLEVPGRKINNVELFLLAWTLVVLILGIMQKRFVYLLAVNVSIFAGYSLYAALKYAGLEKFLSGEEPSKGKKKSSRSRSGSVSPPLLAVIIVSLIALLPVLLNSVSIASSPEFYTADWNDACTWVRDNTPVTSNTYSADMGTMPEYGIMCWWDYGNYILYRAERPAVANNFQTGIDDASRYFIAQNESSANEIMDKRNARYVMMDYRMGSAYAGTAGGIFDNMPYLAGDDPDSYYMSYIMPEPMGKSSLVAYDGNEKYYETMYSRLYYDDGCGGMNRLGKHVNGLEHYRLLYKSPGYDTVKVFEKVKGAKITGKAAPDDEVKLSLKLDMQDGQREYVSITKADASGNYEFTVPYPTAQKSGETVSASKYTIAFGNTASAVEVPEDAVMEGKTITAGGV